MATLHLSLSMPAAPLGAGGDDAALVQTALSAGAAPTPVAVALPAGQLGFKRPVLVSRPYARFKGHGEGVTTVQVGGNYDAFVVGPVAPRTPDGFAYDDASRPDLFGVLDTSVAWAKGQAWGFDTRGRSYAHDLGSGLQFGAWDAVSRSWDYWGGSRGLTVEFAVAGKIAPGTPLFGLGDYQFGASPFWVVSWLPAADGSDTVCLNFRCVGDGPRNRMLVVPGFTFDGRLNRGRAWIDLDAGTAGGWSNGSDRATSWVHAVDAIQPGCRLEPNDHDIPFQIGTPGPNMAFTLCGLAVSNVAVKGDAGTDAGRYLKSSGVVGRFDPKAKEAGRLLNLRDGAAGNGLAGFAVVFDAASVGDFPAGFDLADLTVNGGGAACLAGTFDPRLSRVTAVSGRRGLGAAHTFCNYTLAARDCSFGGDHAAVSLFQTIGRFDCPRLTTGGMATAVETSCSLTWDRAMVVGFGPKQRRVFDLLSGEYAGQSTFNDLVIDGEGVFFADEVFRVENTVVSPRSLTLRNGGTGGLAAGGYVFRLVGTKADSGAFPALIETRGFAMSPCKGVAWVDGPTRGEWRGSFDLRQASGLAGPDGPALDPVKLRYDR